jgi:hypothetical protein
MLGVTAMARQAHGRNVRTLVLSIGSMARSTSKQQYKHSQGTTTVTRQPTHERLGVAHIHSEIDEDK